MNASHAWIRRTTSLVKSCKGLGIAAKVLNFVLEPSTQDPNLTMLFSSSTCQRRAIAASPVLMHESTCRRWGCEYRQCSHAMGYKHFTQYKLQNSSSCPSLQEMYSLSMEERQEAVKILAYSTVYFSCILNVISAAIANKHVIKGLTPLGDDSVISHLGQGSS